MFAQILRFELRYRFRQPATYAYFGVLFCTAFVFMAVEKTFFGPPTGGKVFKNAPEVIANLMLGSTFALFFVAPLAGTPIYRDFKENMYALLYTTPLRKAHYLGGRFAGSLLVAWFVICGIAAGALLGTLMPWNDPSKYTAFQWAAYWQPLVYFGFGNAFFCACVFFAAYAFTRNSLVVYLGGVGLFLTWAISRIMVQGMENESVAALLDAFGFTSHYLTVRHWTIADRNSLLLPIGEYILPNRLLWCGIGLVLLLVSCLTFRMRAPYPPAGKARRIKTGNLLPAVNTVPLRVTTAFGAGTYWRQFWQLTRVQFGNVVRAVPFLGIAAFGVADLIISAYYKWTIPQFATYPLTYQVLELTDDTFGLYFLMIILVYAGELVWRERDVKLQGIFDAFPVPDWLPFAAKFVALLGVQAALLLLLSAVGAGLQAAKGYYHFQWGLYASDFLINFAWCFQLCALCLAVQVLVNHKYVGYGIVILYYIAWFVAADGLGIEHVLVKFGTPVAYQYSDLNGYGHFVAPLVWLNLYYCALALLLALAANLCWVRGADTGFSQRRRLFAQRLTKPAKWFLAGMSVVVLAAGGGIFYRTNVLNDYRSTAAMQARLASYERQYKRYERLPQPKVTAVRTEVDIYPQERWYAMRGSYRLQNKSTLLIDTIILSLAAGKGHSYRQLGFNRPYQVLRQDNEMGLHLYRLQAPLAPGDTLRVSFEYAYRPEGFRSRLTHNGVFNWAAIEPEDRITENGTFIERIPIWIGYQPDAELEDDDIRQRNGLRPKERVAQVNDPAALQNNYISPDGDYIEYEAVVSTDRAQKAITSGDLLATWERDGRRYFHYKAKEPVLNFYAFLSARYRVKRAEWTDSAGRPVEIAVYHDKAHAYNVDHMVEAAKQSLAYYTQAFGQYQFPQLRLLEFPRYKRFAQSFPNTVPFSESAGFVHDLRKPGKIDPVFYLTAHEIAHQWWGHQVIGGNVQGSALLSESLAEYAALMVYRKQFGEQPLGKVLRWDLGEYLKGRHAERKKEVPLVRVENQPYIHYRKGSLALYALQDYLGEARLNQVLRQFLDETRYQARPYPNSLQLVAHLRKATPDSLQYVLNDLFETITLFDNKLTRADYKKRPDGRYEVRLWVESEKMRADSLGNETSISARDWVDVGVFGPDRQPSEYYETSGKALYLRKHRLTQPRTEITLVVDELPAKAGIDPYGKLIDKNRSDNVKATQPGTSP